MSKDVLRRSASSKESKCVLARKSSARVKLVWVSSGEVGRGMSGIAESGLNGRPNSSSLGVALRAGGLYTPPLIPAESGGLCRTQISECVGVTQAKFEF